LTLTERLILNHPNAVLRKWKAVLHSLNIRSLQDLMAADEKVLERHLTRTMIKTLFSTQTKAISAMPRLAGQQAKYLENQLRAFIECRQTNPVMFNVAHSLSPSHSFRKCRQRIYRAKRLF
jgi:hypothetical protein